MSKERDDRLERDPFWYKQGVVYQAHVRSFYDANGDGIGDFQGLKEKAGYLKDLGVTAIWLLPFYPSPLRDDGYDIADYFSIHPSYGTLADFKEFLQTAHGLGLRVITELVVNHTSDQHRWFQRARRSRPGSVWREYYVWSNTAEKYKDARIIFKDFETSNWTWDPAANAYYWHRFYCHQPDLNFENPAVHKEIMRVLDFWLDMGVDGLRLDAVPYLYEQEGGNCENLPATHEFLKTLRRHADEKYGDRMLLAEANQWPEDAVAYFGAGKGDECHMAFHFPLMPRLFMSVRMEDRIPIIDILQQTPPIPETSQWAIFLRNHDELTLEMVTDEERDYMYRVYAQDTKARINLGIRRRLAPLLDNDRRRIELLNALLFSLPGTPVIYYGDEIGMGDNIFLGDRNGVRTPMQWSSDRNAGFSRANPQALFLPVILDPEYHYEAVNVEAQQRNLHSLLWWMKRILQLKKTIKAFGQGAIEFLHPENRKILAFLRTHEEESVLVVANLSRFVQPVELDLSRFQQMRPVEILGRTSFPPITERPYFLTLGPHSFYWFSLTPRFPSMASVDLGELPPLRTAESWEEALEGEARELLERRVARFLPTQRWFGAKAREVKLARVRDAMAVSVGGERIWMLLLDVEYAQGDAEVYFLPVDFAEGAQAEELRRDWPRLLMTRVQIGEGGREGWLFDAVGSKRLHQFLLEAISRKRVLRGHSGELVVWHTHNWRDVRGAGPMESSLSRADQSNSAIVFDERMLLKLFRRLEPGINPDVEMNRFLTERHFPFVPPMAGAVEYHGPKGELMAVGVMHGFVPNSRDAWSVTLDSLSRYWERVRSLPEDRCSPAQFPPGALDFPAEEPAPVAHLVGTYLESARLLGNRIAALHLALADETDDKDFVPEPFTPHYQRSLYQSMRNLAIATFQLLRRRLDELPEPLRPEAERLLRAEGEIILRFRSLFENRSNAVRIRTHGDLHLGQVLHTGKEFYVIDFEGEPARSLSARRLKNSPWRDVAGMIRSFHYAAHAALYQQIEHGGLAADQLPQLEPWAQFWHRWVTQAFLKAYLQAAWSDKLPPKNKDEIAILLDAYLLEKSLYEIAYELNNRPDWVKIPLRGILDLLAPAASS